ncbi:MAG: four helix bundle protein [Bacteroidota bacterium]|nr:four helix bundle protein [Bacteroidota bacterium]
MHKFRELKVYQKAVVLSHNVRELTKKFPKEEIYVLSSQLRRAADSIALNTAEGAGNSSRKEFSKFIGYSVRPAYECIACLDIAEKSNYNSDAERKRYFAQIDEIIAMLIGLQKSLNKSDSNI